MCNVGRNKVPLPYDIVIMINCSYGYELIKNEEIDILWIATNNFLYFLGGGDEIRRGILGK